MAPSTTRADKKRAKKQRELPPPWDLNDPVDREIAFKWLRELKADEEKLLEVEAEYREADSAYRVATGRRNVIEDELRRLGYDPEEVRRQIKDGELVLEAAEI